MKTSVALLALLLPICVSGQQTQSTAVAVSNAAAALHIAEPAAIKVYGKRQIDYEEPLTAVRDDGVWNVYGTLCCPDQKGHRTCEAGKCVGGVVHVSIRQSDGQVVSIEHTK